MAKLEVHLVNEKLAARSSVLPFDESSLSLESIRDPRMREALHEEYKNVSGQARNTMMAMYLKCAEKQKQQCQLDFDAAMADTLDRQQQLPFDEKLAPYMCELLQKRLANVGARLECEYKFKIELFRLSHPCWVHSRLGIVVFLRCRLNFRYFSICRKYGRTIVPRHRIGTTRNIAREWRKLLQNAGVTTEPSCQYRRRNIFVVPMLVSFFS